MLQACLAQYQMRREAISLRPTPDGGRCARCSEDLEMGSKRPCERVGGPTCTGHGLRSMIGHALHEMMVRDDGEQCMHVSSTRHVVSRARTAVVDTCCRTAIPSSGVVMERE